MTKSKSDDQRLSPQGFESAAECLRTLAHPTRLRMIELLLDAEYSVGELAERCRLSPSHASTHLGRMRDRGLLQVELRGRERYYTVAEPALAGILHCVRARFGRKRPKSTSRKGK
ncbi:MAG: winged helix-turn-helix transcriptional regulator [Gemmatimonadetes bacterium]|nr:winged helix-turn-helix transcriptional regulator [Gemmatimonadota bacterium]